MSQRWTAIPTWLIARAVIPWVPPKHPWYGRKFTLREWRRGQTAECRWYDLVFWCGGLALLILASGGGGNG